MLVLYHYTTSLAMSRTGFHDCGAPGGMAARANGTKVCGSESGRVVGATTRRGVPLRPGVRGRQVGVMTNEERAKRVASELSLSAVSVASALVLFGEGATLPFIARYRKEATGGLDEVQLGAVRERAAYVEELETRRSTILASIAEQGKLDDALRGRIEAAATKQVLEDLYLPYRPKRRTRAVIARERGLEPLADMIWTGAAADAAVESAAGSYVSAEHGVVDVGAGLQGARDILAERVAEDAVLRGWVRDLTQSKGVVRSKAGKGRASDVTKFSDYYDFTQSIREIPSHRVLAIRRGEAEGVLEWGIEAPAEEIESGLERRVIGVRRARGQLALVARDANKRLIGPSVEAELQSELKARADAAAITIFGGNLEQLLLASPAGARIVLGLDPGFRTGVKAAVVSATGAVQETSTLYLHQPDRFADELGRLVTRHRVELVAIGNGTASRETDTLVQDVLRARPEGPAVVMVNEAGASVYSASDVARDELPALDVSLRGAVSIARRLQDPLAELVKIEPKSIGVGQYQHDVDQPMLRRRLDDVVEICVNRVGVEVNTASPSLLSYVAGIGPVLAKNIVAERDARGGFTARRDLLKVPRLGAKAFEQSAGFLRVRGGKHPLDATAVHPERYGLVERMAKDMAVALDELIANQDLIARIRPERYVGADVGLPTLNDILDELRRPGRDPRAAFEAPSFRADLRQLKDVKPGMSLEGVVTNVVAFGAFVDIGVHQDGLVHISQLADRFVRDPNEVVKVGQKVRVTVLDVDLDRNRIALSMKQRATARPGAAVQ